ncbi:MAG TPA: AI-2E family transporter [Verrucomicrobiae bacterium]|jgi:predicted PurR-regulated permease PerM|nr:AI-2E family transporter [Verrucomicrobiae bacterium]
MSFPPPTPKQARVLWSCLTSLAVTLLLLLGGLLIWGLGWVLHKLSAILVPMIFALILAYILDPVVEFFQRKRLPRIWSVSLVFALAALLLVAVLGSVLPGLRRESKKLIDDLPKTSALIRTKIDSFLNDSALGKQLPDSWRDPLKSVVAQSPTNKSATSSNTPEFLPSTNAIPDTTISTNSTDLATGAKTTDSGQISNKPVLPGLTGALVFVTKWFYAQLSKISTWAEFLIGFILVPVYLFYFLLEKKSITSRWPDYLPLKPSRAKDETVFVLRAINDCMIVFFRGQVLVALCVGVLLAAGYSLMGLNYAVLLGLVAAVLGIVPYLGTITSLLLALTVAGVQFQDWSHPFAVLAIAALVKLLEDFIIGPCIIGERAGLHPLTIILAVLIGTTLLGGFIGALLAIPLTAALRTLMFRYIWIHEHPRAKPSEVRKELEPLGK